MLFLIPGPNPRSLCSIQTGLARSISSTE
uniref:Uncharacterized protein n=1 Tax=Anguilla anguilla TaxID=7936 RepID=A0A0E9SW31_ANGAN